MVERSIGSRDRASLEGRTSSIFDEGFRALLHGRWEAPAGGNVVTDDELARLSDDELVALIEQRSNLKGVRAREALTIIRGEVPEGTIY